MKKKRLFACAVVVLMLALIGQATYAYFTTTTTAENVISSGGIDVELVETSDGKPWQDVSNIVPGTTISKVVTVENKEQPAYVRAWVEVHITFPEEDEERIPIEAFLSRNDHIDIDFSDAWKYDKDDGHFYYDTVLNTGDTTKPLFTQVKFNGKNLGNEYQNCTLSISVTAEAVQAANNKNAAGWASCEEDHKEDQKEDHKDEVIIFQVVPKE